MTPTAQTSEASPALLAGQALRRDVGERAGDVALRRERLRLGDPREPEVEQPHRDPRRRPRAGRSTASRPGGGCRPRARAPGRRRSARRPRSQPGRRARRRAGPPGTCAPARTRRRCRRGAGRARTRRRAGSSGWRRRAAAAASRSARAAALPSRATILRATSSPVCSSRASQTDPEPPLPRGLSGRYRLRTSPLPSSASAAFDMGLDRLAAEGLFPFWANAGVQSGRTGRRHEHVRRQRHRVRLLRRAGDGRDDAARPQAPAARAAARPRRRRRSAAAADARPDRDRAPRAARRADRDRDRRRRRARVLGRRLPGQEQARRVRLLREQGADDRAELEPARRPVREQADLRRPEAVRPREQPADVRPAGAAGLRRGAADPGARSAPRAAPESRRRARAAREGPRRARGRARLRVDRVEERDGHDRGDRRADRAGRSCSRRATSSGTSSTGCRRTRR